MLSGAFAGVRSYQSCWAGLLKMSEAVKVVERGFSGRPMLSKLSSGSFPGRPEVIKVAKMTRRKGKRLRLDGGKMENDPRLIDYLSKGHLKTTLTFQNLQP